MVSLHRVVAKLTDNDYLIKKLTGKKTVRVIHLDQVES